MEYDKINNLLLSEDNEMSEQFKTPMLRSSLCDYSDAYILVKGTITVMAPGANNGANNIRDKKNRPLILKNSAPFVSCITRINGELIEDADDLDIVMPTYNLLEHSKNYRKTIGSLYNYYRDELINDGNDNFNNRNVVNSEAFKYKNKITGNTYNVDGGVDGYDVNKNGKQEIELAIPLKYLGNFWRALNIPLISCEVSLELKWNKNCIITSLEERQVDAGPETEETYEKIIDISRNNEYTTGNLLDYDYFKKHYKLIAIDLSKQQVLQENKYLVQQINFIGRLENAANIFIIIEKKENTILEFSQNFANVIY